MTALPALFGICRDLFGCIPSAQGLWTAGVFLLASVLSLILGGFTCAVAYLVYKLPWWLGAPYYPHWYQIVLAVVSFTLIEFVVRRFSLVFDLLGDVSYYVAHEDIRTQNIETMSALIGFIAESAPHASVLVAGHSLGSVLASQAIGRLPSTYSGKARTVLLTWVRPSS